MAARPVALILGAGPNIGAAVAKKFSSAGYSVAVVSRNGTGAATAEGFWSLKADFSDPDAIPGIFSAVKTQFKAGPTVVVYNAAVRATPPVENDIFSFKPKELTETLNVNTITPYIAAQQAVEAWKELDPETKKTFIYTGNIMNVKILPIPALITLGMGKSASASWLGLADSLYSQKGMRFFYADERKEDGSLKGMAIDGEAHADFYADLAAHAGTVPWSATFVKGKGYVKFE
jgi:hypothetical protein